VALIAKAVRRERVARCGKVARRQAPIDGLRGRPGGRDAPDPDWRCGAWPAARAGRLRGQIDGRRAAPWGGL